MELIGTRANCGEDDCKDKETPQLAQLKSLLQLGPWNGNYNGFLSFRLLCVAGFYLFCFCFVETRSHSLAQASLGLL